MSASFSAAWLALREPADVRARSERLVRLLNDALPSDRAIAILDLAAGTGSNARFLGQLGLVGREGQGRQEGRVGQGGWVLADHDPELLARAVDLVPFEISTRVVDLSALDRNTSLFEGHDVITASALLDLVSDAWLRILLTRCHALRAHVLFALNYDGRVECSPAEPEDRFVRDLVNRHQRTDKGFGPALGPEAARTVADLLLGMGYTVECEPSDWQLDGDDAELQRQLIDGWAGAASEIAPDEAGLIEGWRVKRQQHVAESRSRITVGHLDVAGVAPPAGANEYNE